MSWIQKLYDTYERCSNNPLFEGEGTLLPVGHTTQQGHIHVVLDDCGNFLRAEVLDKAPITLPATERSAGRTSGEAPHPLIDKIQYCAGDYADFGGRKDSYFASYEDLLGKWCASGFSNHKAVAVHNYISKKTLVRDLVKAGVMVLDSSGKLLTEIQDGDEQGVLRVLPVKKESQRKVKEQGDALVCWSVETPGNPGAQTWTDVSLQNAWSLYDASLVQTKALCLVTGEETATAVLHPAKLRHSGDKAKLISANDENGFTFRGRFTDTTGLQACTVGYEVTQKAHSALRWLIARQGYRNGSQVYITWAASGAPVPSPLEDTRTLLGEDILCDLEEDLESGAATLPVIDHTRDIGQAFALSLRKVMRGYSAKLQPTDDIVVMGLDSATPGRMSIIYYRELVGSEFLKRLENWHLVMAWPQRVTIEEKGSKKGKKKRIEWPVFAPSPRLISEVAYGRRLDEKLRAATIERLVPCIVDGREIPRDLVENCVRHASNQAGLEHWEWEQALGVACAIYKGYYERHPSPDKRRTYSMALEKERTSRDYLYGRLLALAEHIESMALYVGGENRSTTAARLMQRFADRPYSTWRNIELALQPYMQRLQVSRPGYLHNMKNLMGEINTMFLSADFTKEARLSGEFLLGYHCQLQALKKQKETETNSDNQGDES